MISIALQGDTIKSIKKFSFGDIEGVLLEYVDQNIFIPDSITEILVEHKKDSNRFISQFTAERYVRALEDLNKVERLSASEQTFLFSCNAVLRKHDEDFTENHRKSIEVIYNKYSDKMKDLNTKRPKEEDDNIPF